MKAFPAIYQQPHRVDAAMKAQQQGPSYLNRHRGHVSSADGRINDSHPILGNYHLPVDIENVPKPSGLQNLLREGWDEDRKFFSPSISKFKTNLSKSAEIFLSGSSVGFQETSSTKMDYESSTPNFKSVLGMKMWTWPAPF
jgi:hypothetical protein